MNTTSKNLFFLLSAAPMGLGGCVVDLDPFDTSLTTLNNTTETGGDGDGDTGDGDGDGDGDSGDGDGDGDSGDGDGDGDSGDGDGDGDGDSGDGDGDGDACAAYGALNGECYGPEYAEATAMYCQEAISYAEMTYGAECGAATEALYACLSALSCEDFMMDPPAGCEAEGLALEAACFGG